MKKSKIAIICLMLLSFVAAGVFFVFLSDTIPTHFAPDGTPDQFGSKYFMLIFAGIATIVGLVMLLVCRYGKVSENYKKYLLLTGIILEAILLVLLVVMGVYALNYVEDTPTFDISKIMMLLIGLMFIILSNFMPKIEKNRTLGIKTTWSMYNEVTWQKTHRFTGFVGVIVGVIILVSGLFFKEIVNFIIMMSMIAIFMISTSIASYIYYKDEKSKEVLE